MAGSLQMAYVPGSRYDLFISYASENNRDGWVEQFEKALGQELGDLLGRHFGPRESIFFDKRELEVAQSFPQELVNASRESAILVPILSPSYLTSPWCRRERTEFFSKLPHGAEPAGCLSPIEVRPIAAEGLDALYRSAERASFLSSDEQTPLPAASPEWTARLQKFAAQVKNALQRLRRNCKPVFLGKTAETDRSKSCAPGAAQSWSAGTSARYPSRCPLLTILTESAQISRRPGWQFISWGERMRRRWRPSKLPLLYAPGRRFCINLLAQS